MTSPDDKTFLLTTALNRIDELDELVKNQQTQIDALGEAVGYSVSAVNELVKEAKSMASRMNASDEFAQAIMEALVTVMGKAPTKQKE